MPIELNKAEIAFLEEIIRYDLQDENLSGYARMMMKNILEKLQDNLNNQ